MYKIGDKLRCTKDRGIMNLAGKEYEIKKLNIKDNVISVYIEDYSNKIFNYCDYRIFKINEDDHAKTWLLSDHFMSLKEERKLKLKKLNESNLH